MSCLSELELKKAADLVLKRKAAEQAQGAPAHKKAKTEFTGPFLLVRQINNLCRLATNKPLLFPKTSGIKKISSLFQAVCRCLIQIVLIMLFCFLFEPGFHSQDR